MARQLRGTSFERPLSKGFRCCANHGGPSRARNNRSLLRTKSGASGLFLLLCLCGLSHTAEVPIPTIDGGLGPCSVDFTVTNQRFQPLYNAQVHVRFAYGFWGLKKMDLQIGTNSAGKARVKGLPTKLRHPPLDFVITYSGVSDHWYWTGLDCVNQTQVALNVR